MELKESPSADYGAGPSRLKCIANRFLMEDYDGFGLSGSFARRVSALNEPNPMVGYSG